MNSINETPDNERQPMVSEGFRIEPELKIKIADRIKAANLDKSPVFRALAISVLSMTDDELWELVRNFA